jgi:hypothetical protein
MLFDPNIAGDFKPQKHKEKTMSHKKKPHQGKGEHHGKMGRVEPMGKAKGEQHLKPLKKDHKDVSGK